MIYVNMALGGTHGWGVAGRYIVRELANLEPVRLISGPLDAGMTGDPLEFHLLQGLLVPDGEVSRFAPENGVAIVDGPLLQGVGNDSLLPRRLSIRGKPTIGYTFFEHNVLPPGCVENGRRHFERVVTGSTWCTRILTEAGLSGVATAIQGIDPAAFYPATGNQGLREFLADRFVVFSGGKFEYRKAQDVVIRAYKVIQDRHRDVVLVNAWFNPWPATLETSDGRMSLRWGKTGPKGRSSSGLN